MSGEKFEVTDKEFEDMAQAKGSVYVPSLQVWLNMASVSTMYPVAIVDMVEDRKKQTTGVLASGEKVRRHFGEWVLVGVGNGDPVYPDPSYYPEIAQDCVASHEDYERIKATGQDYFEYMSNRSQQKRLGGSGAESIAKIMSPTKYE